MSPMDFLAGIIVGLCVGILAGFLLAALLMGNEEGRRHRR